MSRDLDFSSFNFAPVMDYPKDLYLFDLSDCYDRELLKSKKWGVGRYNEKRKKMYTAPQYRGKRNIHMGIDIWAPAGEPVYAFHDGKVAYMRDNDEKGNYGGTIVTVHKLADQQLFALYGHLSKKSLAIVRCEQEIAKGEKIAELGTEQENGGWVPHLHFQLSVEDPGEADMPGVVADEDCEKAVQKYPDPRLVLGKLY